MPETSDLQSGLGWLSPANTEKALQDNPQIWNDLHGMLLSQGDPRSPAEWLYDDLRSGDTNSQFRQITRQAAGLFNVGGVASNPAVTAPDSPTDYFNYPSTPNDTPGILAQIKDMFTGLVGILGKPSSSFVNAPSTTNNYSESIAVDNSTTLNTYNTGVTFKELSDFFMRFPGFNSVPGGGNEIISPASPTSGYAQNIAQSGPRLGGQTIASVGGLELNSAGIGVGSTGIPWRTIILGAIASLVVFILYRKFFK